MKKVVLLSVLALCSVVSAETVSVSLDYSSTAEPNERVEILITVKNTSTPYLKNYRASVDMGLVGDEIQHFVILSEPSWDETLRLKDTVTGTLAIQITSTEHNKLLRLPLIISGLKGSCPGGCTPFPPEGPFYVEITIKNKGIELFNQAESFYSQEKYQEAMETYDEAKTYFLNYFDEESASTCIRRIKASQGHMNLSAGATYVESGEMEKAIEEVMEARALFEDAGDEEMVAECDQRIAEYGSSETEPPTTPPPSSPAISPSSPVSTTTSPSSPTTPPPSSFSYTTMIALILIVVAIGSILFATTTLRKK